MLEQTLNTLELQIHDWGLIDYQEALARQIDLVDQVSKKNLPSQLVFCTHPPVVTLGRTKGASDDILDWQGEIIEISRGGRATYHGPEQLMIYPILDLSFKRNNLRPRDLEAYLRSLENVIVDCLSNIGIKAHTEIGEKDLSRTGVWVNDRKIASIGIAVKKWVSFHGAAICLTSAKQGFSALRPCGFTSDVMTSVSEETSQVISRDQVIAEFLQVKGKYWA